MSKDILSDVVIHNKYAKFNGKGRESWTDLCMRYGTMMVSKYPEQEKEIWVAIGYMLNKKIVPSMRGVQFAGKPIDLSPNRMFNCAGMNVTTRRVFGEAMFLLLGGSGVGYSVQKRHINQLDSIKEPEGSIRYVVQDSIVGWADAVNQLFKAYFTGSQLPIYDFSDIREKGAPLVTSGGKAPGSEPLRICLEKIDADLSQLETGDRLTPIQVMDMMCYIAEAVLAGGIRRAATICIFDPDEKDMVLAKKGKWWVRNPQRAMANISAVIDKNLPEAKQLELFMAIARRLEKNNSGEPGFIFSFNLDMIFNPCVEASLPDMGFCNLTSVNVGDRPPLVELKKRVYYASFLGTLQAGFTDFYYLRKEWRENAIKDPLLGVSLTGIASLEDEDKYDWKKLGELAKEANIKLAKEIGINPASRVTCIKPEGTSSLVMGTSSGIHDWYAKFYKRRIELTKGEPLHEYLKSKIPKLLEDHYMKANTVCLTIPVKAPDGARIRSEGKALELLDKVVHFNQTWVEGGHTSGDNKHNVSCTINYSTGEFWPLLNKIFEQRGNLSGVSLLPFDNGTYRMPPFEACGEAEFNRLSKLVRDIDLSEVIEDIDMTDLSGEVACGGGGCEVK